ncbi:MAG: DUF501 domain-containing protein [Thermoleophilia bacterium]|nr:DUF501 domain-containing protein [Thermoleophilia bacterium]
MHDRAVVAWQIKREPRALGGVAARCVFGFPAVTKQLPFDEQGRPFPTAYYVTCPHLTRQIDRIESDGGVRRFESKLIDDERLMAATTAANDAHAAIDGRGQRIAAAGEPGHLKCLHAHAGFRLAGHDHPLGDEVLREAAPTWCSGAKCAAVAGTGDATSK